MIKKINTLLFSFSLVTMSLYGSSVPKSGDVINQAKAKSGIELFLENYDWNNIWKELTITPKITTCKVKKLTEGLVSPMVVTLSEPLYIAEATIKKGQVKTFQMNISSDPSETGTNNDDGGIYINVFKFPLMHMLLKNTTKGLLVFEKGYIKITYLGVFDPKKWNNSLALSMNPERMMTDTVKAALASVASCGAFSAYNLLSPQSKRKGKIARYLKATIDTFYYSDGCLGTVPVGTSTTHQVPIANAILGISSVFSDMFSKRGVVNSLDAKHTTQNILNGYSKEILCRPVFNPIFPKTQYSIQLIYPTVSPTEELGVPPAVYDFRGSGAAYSLVVFAISQRRDYAAFAYKN